MLRFLLVLVVVAACEKPASRDQQGQAPKGIPPSGESKSGPSGDPHAGMGLGAPGDDLANPHAEAPMANPHGGNPPGAPVVVGDPTMVIEGTISAGKDLAETIKAGDRIFLSVRSIGTDGEVVRFPIAVDRVDVVKLPVSFRLSSANMMMKGAVFAGKVEVSARVDRDGEARTREPGDVEGKLVVTIPNKQAKLILDTPVK